MNIYFLVMFYLLSTSIYTRHPYGVVFSSASVLSFLLFFLPSLIGIIFYGISQARKLYKVEYTVRVRM